MKRDLMFSLTLLFIIPLTLGNRHEKCCKQGHQIVKQNSNFICINNSTNRIQTNLKNTDFFNRNLTGTCIEVYSKNEIAIFSVNSTIRKITRVGDAGVHLFPKCCPLGHQYDKKNHSCAKEKNSDDLKALIPDDSFIKIGLFQCKIVFDQILNSMQDVKHDDEKIVLVKTGKVIPKGEYCADSTLEGKPVVRICAKDIQICGQIRCIHKCCPDGQSFVNGSKCHDTFKYGVDLHASSKIEEPDGEFAIIHGIQPPIAILSEKRFYFRLDRAGLFTSYLNKTNSFQHYPVGNETYCMEHAYKKGVVDGYTLFSSVKKHDLETKFAVTRWVKLMSCIFLLLTILVYIILPKLRNLFGKILLCYSVATFLFFFFLAFSQFYYDDFSDALCKIIGYATILSSIWSFTWLHIMCIDIWLSFGKPRTLAGPLQKNERKTLIKYSLYGWGLPIVWVLLIFLFNTSSILPDSIHPYVGVHICYLENSENHPGNYAFFIFNTLPVLIQQIVNTILFVKTIIYCIRIKAEIERMNDARTESDLNASKERLVLIMKLSVIMGISFLFETISSMYNFQKTSFTKYLEVVWDTINCLQGVFIFIIFICKKKIFDSLREKIAVLEVRKTSMSSSATTQITLANIPGDKGEKMT